MRKAGEARRQSAASAASAYLMKKRRLSAGEAAKWKISTSALGIGVAHQYREAFRRLSWLSLLRSWRLILYRAGVAFCQ